MRDLRSNNNILGSSTLLIAHLQQTVPVIVNRTPADVLHVQSQVQSKHLTVNMRSLLHTGQPTTQFSELLLRISNGQITTTYVPTTIDTNSISHTVSSPNNLCSAVYPNLTTAYTKSNWLHDKCSYLTQSATFSRTLLQISGHRYRPRSSFTLFNKISQLHPHKIHLKVGYPIIFLRNLNAPILRNGTRLVDKQMMDHVIEAQIIMGHGKNDTVFIPEIPLTPADCSYAIQRLQFPLKLSLIMTINKVQGQSLKVVGLDLRTSCFSHGQVYVGCTRVGHPENLFIYAPEGKTKNVVYEAALE
ncbi:uncharacterized protein LOC106870915 [Octopus bimaculoides]|nr:uncharacterized protein LOC106870915 [Octopus bimaculoides]|eukprot:XP_014772635.1 PREDICTED: uncharacterized protein LOC106870915 [Octopus bimaculoides]